jgi:hypothetical protein
MKLVGERRAIAAAVLAFYAFLWLVQLIAGPPEGWGKAIAAMTSVYAIGFFGVVAGYFWARWYSIGLGLSGVITTAVSLWQMGPEPIFLFYGGTHAAIALALWGEGMSRTFDGREEWRARFHMDEAATHRLGRAVIRIGISLPYILLYALAPRPPAGLDEALLALGALGLAGAGTWGLFRLRTWGLVALTGATGLLAVGAVTALAGGADTAAMGPMALDMGVYVTLATIALGAAVVPFARPVVDYIRGR